MKHLVPKKGQKVRDPLTGAHFPEEGLTRNITTYFDRRIKDGDLIVRDIPAENIPVVNAKENNAGKNSKKDGDK